jgi:hypothetical protein
MPTVLGGGAIAFNCGGHPRQLLRAASCFAAGFISDSTSRCAPAAPRCWRDCERRGTGQTGRRHRPSSKRCPRHRAGKHGRTRSGHHRRHARSEGCPPKLARVFGAAWRGGGSTASTAGSDAAASSLDASYGEAGDSGSSVTDQCISHSPNCSLMLFTPAPISAPVPARHAASQ